MRTAAIIFTLMFCLLMCSCTGAEEGVFDGDNAYGLLKQQIDIGDRSPGTPGARKCITLIKDEMSKYCSKVYEDRFTADVNGKKLKLTNIIAVQNPAADKWILLASHWDNRPMCDQEKDKALQKNYCPGANDGASSTALLMETARVLKEHKADVGIIYVFFDGEDYGHGSDEMFLGSTWFARHTDRHFVWKGKKKSVKYGILLDMIGDKHLNINIEKMSKMYAPEQVEAIWHNAKEAGYEKYFVPTVKYAISDDHIPLNEIAGVPTVDIIDFDYPSWHTTKDTPDKCSPRSLKIVGDVILKTLFAEEK